MKIGFQVLSVFAGFSTMLALFMAFIDPATTWLALSCCITFIVSFVVSTIGE